MKGHFWKIFAAAAAVSIGISTVSAVSVSTSMVSYAGTWVADNGQWKYRNDDGSYAKGWFQDGDGRWYYLDSNGRMLADTVTPDGYRVGSDGAWIQDDPYAAYDADYPLKDYVDKAGLQYVDVIMGYNRKDEPIMERRLRQDQRYSLYNYFGLSDDLCKALYGEDTDQIGTGEMAADGDSLLVLAQVALYQEAVGSDTYKQQRNALVIVIRDYLNSFQWRSVSELERAQYAALYIANNCTYDRGLYNRFVAGEDTNGDPSFTAYGCLVNHKAVCEGMSVAYQLLARSTGLNAFCAPDDSDKDHMFVYVQAGGNWYKVDLAVTGLTPQALVRRCFNSTVNQEVDQIMKTYLNEENPHNQYMDLNALAPGAVYELHRGKHMRGYQQ